MDTCAKCGMPIDDDSKCSCDSSLCYHCCECESNCVCGCSNMIDESNKEDEEEDDEFEDDDLDDDE